MVINMEEILNIISNFGVSIAVVLYFLWKDAKLTKENTDILMQVKQLLEILTNSKKEGE